MTRPRTLFQACFAVSLGLMATTAQGHEFWIDPVDPIVAVGETVEGNIRVGEMMKGSGMIYNPNSFNLFSAFTPSAILPVEGRMGDRPALQLVAEEDGLLMVAHMTTARKLTYETFDKFASFVDTHGQSFAKDVHREKGLPEEDFVEAYFRCAKALIKVGSGSGDDRMTGMPFELTALTNPYTSDGPLRFVLTYKGKPKSGHQVDLFHKATPDADATMTSYQTNEAGEVTLPRSLGDFMVNAVVLEEPSANVAAQLDAIWVSLWASTTYSIE